MSIVGVSVCRLLTEIAVCSVQAALCSKTIIKGHPTGRCFKSRREAAPTNVQRQPRHIASSSMLLRPHLALR